MEDNVEPVTTAMACINEKKIKHSATFAPGRKMMQNQIWGILCILCRIGPTPKKREWVMATYTPPGPPKKGGVKCGHLSCIVSGPHLKSVDCSNTIPTTWGACPKNKRGILVTYPLQKWGNIQEKKLDYGFVCHIRARPKKRA